MSTLASVGEAARRLHLSIDTVRALERAGAPRATRTAGGHRRFSAAVILPHLTRHRGTTATWAEPSPEAILDDRWDDAVIAEGIIVPRASVVRGAGATPSIRSSVPTIDPLAE